MYAVVVEFGEHYWQKNCENIVTAVRFIADVIYKEGMEDPTKIWIDKVVVE